MGASSLCQCWDSVYGPQVNSTAASALLSTTGAAARSRSTSGQVGSGLFAAHTWVISCSTGFCHPTSQPASLTRVAATTVLPAHALNNTRAGLMELMHQTRFAWYLRDERLPGSYVVNGDRFCTNLLSVMFGSLSPGLQLDLPPSFIMDTQSSNCIPHLELGLMRYVYSRLPDGPHPMEWQVAFWFLPFAHRIQSLNNFSVVVDTWLACALGLFVAHWVLCVLCLTLLAYRPPTRPQRPLWNLRLLFALACTFSISYMVIGCLVLSTTHAVPDETGDPCRVIRWSPQPRVAPHSSRLLRRVFQLHLLLSADIDKGLPRSIWYQACTWPSGEAMGLYWSEWARLSIGMEMQWTVWASDASWVPGLD